MRTQAAKNRHTRANRRVIWTIVAMRIRGDHAKDRKHGETVLPCQCCTRGSTHKPIERNPGRGREVIKIRLHEMRTGCTGNTAVGAIQTTCNWLL